MNTTATSKPMIAALTALMLMLSACTKEHAPHEQSTQDEHSEPSQANPNLVEIPPSVRTNLGITFSKVQRRLIQSTIRIPGAFELQPLARREYRMTLPGHIELAVDQYDHVEEGDLLFRFKCTHWPELQHEIILAEQEIESAQSVIEVVEARMTEAQQRLTNLRQRLESLSNAQVRNAELEAQASEIEASLPRLRAELSQSLTQINNAKRTLEHALHRASVVSGVEESKLVAPIQYEGTTVPTYLVIDWIEIHALRSGIVEALHLTDGAYAESPTLVLSTINPDQVRFRAQALQADLPRLSNASTARIVPPIAPGIDPADSVKSSAQLGLEAHPEQRTVTVLATPASTRSWIRPGVSAFLEVVIESSEGSTLAIPRSAIVRDGIEHVYFRRDPKDPNRVIRTKADMGVDDGRWVAIKSGLGPNDEVVLQGAYELKLATQQSGDQQQGGHFHADGTFHNEEED
ncbi:MAG: hypothetical protein JJ974_03475 [Phycisphaerales bacterium]|nr:hypothetical protein [Phycisphaerales bacterium]